MPPPLTKTYYMHTAMSYLDHLRQEHAAWLAQREAEKTKAVQTTSRPRDIQRSIREWWSALPPTVRNHPWGIEQIIAEAFKGEARPQLGQLGLALRAMGWTSKRSWTVASRNRRTWHPPQE